MHSWIVVLVLLEMFLSFRQYPSKKVGLFRLLKLCIVYIFWAHGIKLTLGIWVYPLLAILDVQSKIIFYVFLLFFVSLFYFLGEFLNSIVWKKELRELAEKNENKKKY